MTVSITPSPRQQFEDANGLPYSGGKLFTYIAGTTTKQATYTDSTGSTANTNPIILDSSGRTPSGVWLTNGVSYKFVLAPSTDTDPPTSPILTENGLTGVNAQPDIKLSEWLPQIIVPTYISATSFSLPLDQTTEYHYGRRVKLTTSTGFRYGTIITSVFTTLTTITVFLDGGALDSSLSAIELGLVSESNTSLPELTNRHGINIIINPGFTINNRAYVSAAALAPGAYGHDRWKAGASGGDYSFTQLASNTVITIASGKSLIQVVEDKNVQDSSLVVSWSGTALGRVGVNSDTPSGAYAASPIVITGQTAGTVMSVEFGAGTLGDVQLEKGAVATQLENRPYGIELALCQRYYENITTGMYGYSLASSFNGVQFGFRVTKRVAPTITKVSDLSLSNVTSVVAQNIFIDSFMALAQITASGNCAFITNWTASAEL